MNEQIQHSIFAERIAKEFIDEITGEGIEKLIGKTPEEKFIVGQLSSKVGDIGFLSSKTIINSIGVNFNIPFEDRNKAEFNIFLCGNLFYRVYPTYDEQCKSIINQYSKTFKKEFRSIKDILKDDKVIKTIWDEKKRVINNNYKVKILPVYRKISLENFNLNVNIKVVDVYDEFLKYGSLNDQDKLNRDLDAEIQDIIYNYVTNAEDYYRNEIKEKISLFDLESEEKWKDFIENSVIDEIKIHPNWKIAVNFEIKKCKEDLLVSIKLCNNSEQVESEIMQKRIKEHTRISTLFNARLKLELIKTKYCPIELTYFKDDYKYNRTQPAIGFNCNIDFNELKETNDYIVTTNIPIFMQYRLKTNDSISAKFSDLISNPVDTLMNIYDGMQDTLNEWNQYYSTKIGKLTSIALANMQDEINDFEDEIYRFKIGIDLIENYSIIKKSFVLMNQAFANSPKNYGGWRLFQIVYIVSVILDNAICEKTIEIPECIKEKATFEEADVIFFPTGGGKTEAFLGTVVYNLFFDRLRGKNAGVTAILRYPLRLLAAQQASRVANILSQAELIRKNNQDMINSDEFSMGYLCGEGSTPNKLGASKIKEIMEQSQEERDKNFLVVEKCPYCNSDLHIVASEESIRLMHICSNKDCIRSGVIPVYIVDSEIYRYLPSVIISTVDKMAAIGNNRNFTQILKGSSRKCSIHGYCSELECIESNDCKENHFETINMYDPAPTLLIQDELHLIRESLGTYDSHYESMIDYYCKKYTKSHRGMKVIGATATISNYEEQIKELFMKVPKRFPCESINLKKHFYSYVDEKDINRIIIGYAPFGRAIINGVVYSMKEFRKVIWKYVSDPGLIREINGLEILTDDEVDKLIQDYWLPIEYNNVKLDSSNVIGALNNPINIELVEEDVRQYTAAKMTGDDSFQDVRKILAKIENAKDIVNDVDFNMISATSMISHGVDADRFNSILFFGMPGSTAEYIQAYSRAGRKYTGLVVDIIRPIRPTDQSYLRYFQKFHEYKDILVDPVPINRWANKAIDVTLPGAFCALILGVYYPKLKTKIYMMPELKKVIADGKIPIDEVKQQLYEIYGCIYGDGVEREIARIYKRKINEMVDTIYTRILDKTCGSDYITTGLNSIGFHVMNSLRDTEKQLLVEVE